MTDYTAAVVSAGNHEVPDKWKEVEEEVEDRKARYALEGLSLWSFNWLLLPSIQYIRVVEGLGTI